MESQVKISFFLNHSKITKERQTPIYLRIRYNFEHVTISTGYSISATTWDKKYKKIKGASSEANSVNNGLKALEVKIRNTVTQMILVGKPFNVNNIKDQISHNSKKAHTLIDAFEKYLEMVKILIGKDYSPLTLVKYKQTYNRVMEFAKYKYNRITFYLIDLDDLFMENFEMYLKTVVNNNNTTIYKHWQRLSRVIRFSIKQHLLEVFPFTNYKIRLPKKRVEYLSKVEIQIIENKDFGNERLNKVRDFFVFSIYSGLAYQEIFNLKYDNLVIGIDGEIWIDMFRQKTKKNYCVPLLPSALKIIDKYKNEPFCLKTGKTFPLPSNQKMNAYLKEIQDICKISTVLTCHLARKTFSCTIMLLNGVSILVLSQCLGHSNIRVTIDSYASVLPEMVASEFGMLRKKLKQ